MNHRTITLRMVKTYTNGALPDNYSYEGLAEVCRTALDLVNACRAAIDAEDANAGLVGTWNVEVKSVR